jgi:serine/threonine-protein phosphatase 5
MIETPLPSLEEAQKLKEIGNKKFSEQRYAESEIFYTKAIDMTPLDERKLLAVLYSNRAFSQLKLENFGSAITDANKALECDPSYVKAYYRRGSAHLILRSFDDAKNDFKKVVQIVPNDKESRSKFIACKKAIKQLKFAEAISFDSKKASETVNINEMTVESDYTGPHLEEDGKVTLNFILEMIEHFKNQKNLHKKYLYTILLQAKEIFSKLQNIVKINIAENELITVCGDVHGQFYDVLNIFSINGNPSPSNQYLFNGDFVDRGSFSCEVIITFLAFKVLYPEHFFMSRGNHESKALHKIYGFEGETLHKYGQDAYDIFCEIFNYLPLGHTINDKVFVIHGGLFGQDGVKLQNINAIDRNCEPPTSGLMSDILWADPQKYPGRMPSKRGVGSSFGPDVTKNFLDENGLQLVIRSHEVRQEGYEVEQNGLLITVFSAPNYCDQFGNKGAFIKLKQDMKPEFFSFSHVPHPPVPPMAYATNLYGI